ncbi:hypothetical protein V6N13_109238 [Hibiscus sabdariffa]
MSTKAKLTRCEVSKARLIYPFSKADVTDSSGFILIGYQKDKNYALTGRHLCLSSPIRRPLAEREIEDQERYKEEVSTPLQEDWLLSTSSFSSSDSSYTITFGVDQEMLPESKKKFWTNAVNGGGSGCSGDSFLLHFHHLHLLGWIRLKGILLEGRRQKALHSPQTTNGDRAGLVAGAGGFFSFDGLEVCGEVDITSSLTRKIDPGTSKAKKEDLDDPLKLVSRGFAACQALVRSERGHFPPVLSSFFCWIAAPALTPMDQTESDDSLYHLLQGPFLFYFLNSVRKDFTVDSAESPTSVYLYEQSIHPDLDPYPDHPVSSFGSPRIINPGSRNTHSIMEMTYI